MTTLSSNTPSSLDSAFEHCRAIAREHARNFYYGLRLTPEPRRSAIYALYAFLRLADDDTDLTSSNPKARLEKRRETLNAILSGAQAPNDPVWLALAHTLRAFPINSDDLHDMLLGLEEDLDHQGYQTRTDLQRYCYRVASTVGLICISVWGLKDPATTPRARELAIHRGLAFQLTNILRDIKEDLAAGRCYIPREDLARHNLTPDDLLHWRHPDRCAALIADLADWAQAEYDASQPLDDLIDPACLPTLWAMTTIYHSLLLRLRAKPDRIVTTRRVRLPAPTKAAIAATALLRARRALA
ncbi:MAG: phytoene/squalene synthase family protein [Phycisphaerales bacterium]